MAEKRNLGKDLKIKNLMAQRDYIIDQLKKMLEEPDEDGNAAYGYVGYVFPENIDYFRLEGFGVRRFETDAILQTTMGMPIYIFNPVSEDLTAEEFKESREEANKTHAKAKKAAEEFDEKLSKAEKIINSIFMGE